MCVIMCERDAEGEAERESERGGEREKEKEGEIQLTFFGSLFKQRATNSLKAFEKVPCSSGGLLFGMRKRTLIGWRSA